MAQNQYTIRITERQLEMLNEAMADLVVKHAAPEMNSTLWGMMMLRTMISNAEYPLSTTRVNDFTE